MSGNLIYEIEYPLGIGLIPRGVFYKNTQVSMKKFFNETLLLLVSIAICACSNGDGVWEDPYCGPEFEVTATCSKEVLQKRVSKYFEKNATVRTLRDGTFIIQLKTGYTEIPTNAFNGCSWLTSVRIGDSDLITIKKQAFRGCENLTSVVLSQVFEIGDAAFYNCKRLERVTIYPSIALWGSCVFQSCTSLIEVNLKDGLEKIGKQAFANCLSLSSIVIPHSVTEIGGYAFADCALKKVYCKPTTPPRIIKNSRVFGFVDSNSELEINVPTASLDEYKNHPDWSEYSLILKDGYF